MKTARAMSTTIRTASIVQCAALAVLAGCAGVRRADTGRAPMTALPPRIELLGFPDCPNTPELRDNLEAALSAMGKGWTYTETNQEQLPESDLRRGWPTPTILVNGRDLFGMPAPTAPSMGCRMYAGGVPDAQTIAAWLKTLGHQ
jgi:hypothetical protein